MNQNHFIQRIHQMNQNHQICQNLQIHQNHLICQIQIFILPCPQPFNLLCVQFTAELSPVYCCLVVFCEILNFGPGYKIWSRFCNFIEKFGQGQVPQFTQKYLIVTRSISKCPNFLKFLKLLQLSIYKYLKMSGVFQRTQKYPKVPRSI